MSALLDAYQVLLLDLDGTVYHGPDVVGDAGEVVGEVKRRHLAVRFITNNASRAPEEVANQLTGIGVPAKPTDVSTSGQAAAAVLAGEVADGDHVLVLGTEALAEEIRARGLRAVQRADDGVAAVVQGLSKRTGWAELAEACLALRAGSGWVACNADPVLPTEQGMVPGNGAMVAALTAATGRTPTVAGKPERPLFDQAVASCGGGTALVVGDRLDTDIAGANNAELDGMLVLSGVTTAADLLAAPPEHRPRYLANDLRGVLRPAELLEIGERVGWQVRVGDGAIEVAARGNIPGEPLELLRAMCAAWWRASGNTVPEIRAADEPAGTALAELGLG
ncbi:MAG: HAD-IIA family hydrolase [Pseudonocardiaceae bacterium]|nr:HAD-IIA family hydrolase [Pseudonocardiaceae bacterium]